MSSQAIQNFRIDGVAAYLQGLIHSSGSALR